MNFDEEQSAQKGTLEQRTRRNIELNASNKLICAPRPSAMQFKQSCCATRRASAMHPYHAVCHYAKSVDLENQIFAKVFHFFIHHILEPCTLPQYLFDATITCRVGREQLTGFILGLNPRVYNPFNIRQDGYVTLDAHPRTRVCQIEKECREYVLICLISWVSRDLMKYFFKKFLQTMKQDRVCTTVSQNFL